MFPFLVILAMVLYFVPAFIAANRGVKRTTAIFFSCSAGRSYFGLWRSYGRLPTLLKTSRFGGRVPSVPRR